MLSSVGSADRYFIDSPSLIQVEDGKECPGSGKGQVENHSESSPFYEMKQLFKWQAKEEALQKSLA